MEFFNWFKQIFLLLYFHIVLQKIYIYTKIGSKHFLFLLSSQYGCLTMCPLTFLSTFYLIDSRWGSVQKTCLKAVTAILFSAVSVTKWHTWCLTNSNWGTLQSFKTFYKTKKSSKQPLCPSGIKGMFSRSNFKKAE